VLPDLMGSMVQMEAMGSKEMVTEVAVLLAGQEGPVRFLVVFPVEMEVLAVQGEVEHLLALVVVM
jgi:hypothetical protein